jgi:hypothetical protein
MMAVVVAALGPCIVAGAWRAADRARARRQAMHARHARVVNTGNAGGDRTVAVKPLS